MTIRCHYDVLGVERDADEKTIKKAHRKLALRYHPDKNYGDEEAAKEFRLVQQAYECLSDPAERKYYNEHRECILRGVKPGEADGDGESEFMFDVTPYHFSGCYDGYGDGKDGFFAVYKMVFDEIIQGEKRGWISEGNIDETKMPNYHLLDLDFGNGSTEWSKVSHFYNSWGSFSSCLSFAFADKYDPREAESRWVRRRIDDENKKARKIAKRERNDDIISFVEFVKKRDPRVKDALAKAEKEKADREKARKEEAARKKVEAAAAREAWLEEREAELREAELEDINAGRIRLADLSDSDDDYYGKKKKGKKRGKKGKKKKQRWSSSEEEEEEEEVEEEVKEQQEVPFDGNIQTEGDEANDVLDALNDLDIADDAVFSDSSYESSEEEPQVWKCEWCKKTFKSEAQFNNHLNSKKHKETYKKWQKKNKS